jgi:hypothetical protein
VAEIVSTLQKKFVVTIAPFQPLVGIMPDGGLEAPHVRTSLEGLELVRSEVPRHDLLSKPGLVEDNERLPVRCPADDVIEPFILCVFEDFM